MFPLDCDLPVVETVIKCPLGYLDLKTCNKGVHRLQFQIRDDQKIDLNKQFEQFDSDVVVENENDANLTEPANVVIAWLKAYFQNPRELANIGLPDFCFLKSAGRRDPFADRMLEELMKTKFGDTITYGELAERAGQDQMPGHTRVAGWVAKSNPACLIIPCHRVILKSGASGHYAGGDPACYKDEYHEAIKAWLLDYEAEKAKGVRMIEQ